MTFNWNGVTSETAAFNEYVNIFIAVIVGIGQLIKSIIKWTILLIEYEMKEILST